MLNKNRKMFAFALAAAMTINTVIPVSASSLSSTLPSAGAATTLNGSDITVASNGDLKMTAGAVVADNLEKATLPQRFWMSQRKLRKKRQTLPFPVKMQLRKVQKHNMQILLLQNVTIMSMSDRSRARKQRSSASCIINQLVISYRKQTADGIRSHQAV